MTFQKISNCLYFFSGVIGSQNNGFTPVFEGYITVISTSVEVPINASPSPRDSNEEESEEFEVADCFLYLPYL